MSSRFRRSAHFLLSFALVAALVVVFFGAEQRAAAQGTTATILGVVTDSTGAAIPDASVQVKNVGTGQTQSSTSDAQGRYRVADLGVGDYEVQASKNGFSTLLHKGITLTVGSQNVVDFSLAVGQTQQTVTVEGAVTQVETTNATVGALVNQAQMRELPLNGRNFEQLIQLAPGVQNYYAGTSGLNMREGKDSAISVAGGRPEGTAFLMDDQNLQTFYNRGLGSITGSSLGVESIGEFQTLTNTYGAQFGGNGAVMNAVTKSGTNSIHGSAYEFLRNSALDAREFTDPSNIPAYRRNQFGGTVAGPVKKDKAFFFFNYEGVRLVQGFSQSPTVPIARASTATDPKTAAAINAVLALYPVPTFNINPAAGTGQATVVRNNTAHENYYLGRVDYNFSEKDSVFGRYFIDLQNAVYPFTGGNVGLWPEIDNGANQFFNLEERHIISPTLINVARASFSRTNVSGVAGATHDALQLFPGVGRGDATIAVTGLTTIGSAASAPSPSGQVQNRYSEGDDLAWTHGSHSVRFGASIDRVQSATLWTFQGQSSWTFGSIPLFLAGTARTVTGVTAAPSNNPIRDFRELDYAFYAQDDWKISSRLTMNIGLRYQPASNPVETHNNLNTIVNYLTDTAFTKVPNVMSTNPSMKNFDPRIGIAFDPFNDHKTSIRGGFGIFHEVLYAGVWSIGFINSPPWNILTQASPSGQNTVPFQNPSILGGSPPLTSGAPPLPSISTGYAYQLNRTPYMIQYNLNVQRELMAGTVLSVGYVGSHGVNLISGQEQNPVPYSIDAAGVYHFAPTTVGSQRINPNLAGFSLGVNGTNSRYNSLQASLNRRMTHNLQAQVSYTYSKCMTTGDATLGSLAANVATLYSNPHDRQPDYSVCGYNVPQSLRFNSLYALPFHGNRLVEGWQITGILAASSGLPFNVTDGVDQSNQINGVPRPDYAPNNPALTVNGISYPACNNNPLVKTVGMWFNPNCFNQETFGTLGNFGRQGLVGPGLVNADIGFLKSTRIRENMNLQFRAEMFNIFNHTNLSYPAAAVFSGTASATGTLGRNATAGQITTYASPSREIQLGLKLVF
jgi:Carboxypeptidase regulatory-like domain/TonB dependent receptor